MSWLTWLSRHFYQWRYKRMSLETCEDPPESFMPGVCYYLQDDGFPWAVTFLCPCGCRETIMVNLVGSKPVWKAYIFEGNLIKLRPSIWRESGCKSHFWITHGKVIWAR